MPSDKPYRGRFLVKMPDGTEVELSSEAVDMLDAAVKDAISRLPMLEGDTIFLVPPEGGKLLGDEWLCNTCAHNMFAVAGDTVRCGGEEHHSSELERALNNGSELYMRRVKSCAWYEKQKGGDSHGMQEEDGRRG